MTISSCVSALGLDTIDALSELQLVHAPSLAVDGAARAQLKCALECAVGSILTLSDRPSDVQVAMRYDSMIPLMEQPTHGLRGGMPPPPKESKHANQGKFTHTQLSRFFSLTAIHSECNRVEGRVVEILPLLHRIPKLKQLHLVEKYRCAVSCHLHHRRSINHCHQ